MQHRHRILVPIQWYPQLFWYIEKSYHQVRRTKQMQVIQIARFVKKSMDYIILSKFKIILRLLFNLKPKEMAEISRNVSHMDRSEIKVWNSGRGGGDISYAERDFETENFTWSGLFSRDYFYVKTTRHSRSQLGQFFVHRFEIWQFSYSKITKVQTVSAFF